MEVTYTYHTLNNKKIVIRNFKGDIFYDDIVSSFDYLLDEMKVCQECNGILTDLSDARFKVKLKEIPKLSAYLRTRKELKKIKLAVLVKTPEDIVLPLILIRKIPFLKIKPFSTMEQAMKWISK